MRRPGSCPKVGEAACDRCGAVLTTSAIPRHQRGDMCKWIRETQELYAADFVCVGAGHLIDHLRASDIELREGPRPIFSRRSTTELQLRRGRIDGVWAPSWAPALIRLKEEEFKEGGRWSWSTKSIRDELKQAQEDEEYRKARLALAACLKLQKWSRWDVET